MMSDIIFWRIFLEFGGVRSRKNRPGVVLWLVYCVLLLVYDVGLWLVYGVVLLLVYGVVLLHVCGFVLRPVYGVVLWLGVYSILHHFIAGRAYC